MVEEFGEESADWRRKLGRRRPFVESAEAIDVAVYAKVGEVKKWTRLKAS